MHISGVLLIGFSFFKKSSEIIKGHIRFTLLRADSSYRLHSEHRYKI